MPSSNIVFCRECNVSLYKNPTAAFPTAYKTYMYNSVINTLKSFFSRKNFVENIKKWTTSGASICTLRDIYDGRVWNEFKLNVGDALPFVKESVYNLMLTINVDWFQPYKGTQYPVGVMYLTIQNLPREVQNLRNNIILAGSILLNRNKSQAVMINTAELHGCTKIVDGHRESFGYHKDRIHTTPLPPPLKTIHPDVWPVSLTRNDGPKLVIGTQVSNTLVTSSIRLDHKLPPSVGGITTNFNLIVNDSFASDLGMKKHRNVVQGNFDT
ncbi:hypothetical protein RMATCC62417_12488 [Rhizopus microsporus]|nr:hypothetical protein RMATCC62417_12488 [Rhizopus microsporus]